MKITCRVSSNMKNLQQYVRDVTLACEKQVAVGFPADAPGIKTPYYNNGKLSVLEVARANNYGTATIPERNFMDEATRLAEDITKALYAEAAADLKGKRFDQMSFLNRLGKQGAAAVKKAIATGDYTPNAEATIKRKGRDEPLIDTAHMYESATYSIRNITSYGRSSRLLSKNDTSRTRSWDFVQRTVSR